MEEWKEYKLGEITNMKNGKKRPQNNGVFPVYGGNGIMDYSDSYNAENAIIVGRVGAYCGCVYKCESKCWVSDNAISIFAKDIADTQFLYYLMTTLDFHHHHIGGAQPLMTQDIIGDFTVSIPPLSIQHQIIQVLKSLDDKIEVNKRINDNLERQAQALFKSWFVDFEPFKGRKFVDSELGMIPEGWRVGTLNELIISTLGGDWGKEDAIGNYVKKVSCIRGADIPEIRQGNRGNMPTRFILNKNFLNKALKAEDLVVEISGGSPTQSTGRICQISDTLLKKYDNVVICTNFCRAIKTKRPYSQFIYYLWEYLYKRGVMFLYENGTTGIKNLDINGLLEKEIIVIPDENTVHKYTGICNLFSQIVQSNGYESERLVKLRDTLLPKLMSGELKNNDINN